MVTASSDVTGTDIVAGLRRLRLDRRILSIHVSLRSFGHLEGGPGTLIDSLLSQGSTLLVATMSSIFAIPSPLDDRPARNGIDYAEQDRDAAASPWPGSADVYDESRTETDRWLGALSAHVAARADRIRCRLTPDFCAVGPFAAELIAAEVQRDVYGPVRELSARDGWVVLMGVSLTRMTLLHLAEIEAGRHPFIRWMRAEDGSPTRVMGGECSRGFDNLEPVLSTIERRTIVGRSLWRAFPARDALQRAAEAIRKVPAVTHCPDPHCIECNDAVAGGPLASMRFDEKRRP